jgi:prophage tail gpP-like protein
VGKFFEKLAAARGLFVSDDETGALVFRKINADASPVAHIEFPGRIATDWSHTYDDTTRFFRYVAVTKTEDGKQAQSKAFTDEQVPAARQLIFSADDNRMDTLDAAAEWAALRLALDAATAKVPVSTWTAPDGTLWTPNTAVTVKSPVLDIPDTRRMIIRGVEFEYSADNRSAVLSLIPVLKIEGGKLIMEDA